VPLKDLPLRERMLIKQCMDVVVAGEVIEHVELQTLCGLEAAYFTAVVDAWPLIDDALPDVFLAINGALNNLLGYPHGRDDIWESEIQAERVEVERIYRAWLKDFVQTN
jgi:hypothetical protein